MDQLKVAEEQARDSQEDFLESLSEKVIEGTVPSDGRCRDEQCRGRIVAEVISLGPSGFGTDTPRCSNCGREYPYGDGKDVLVVGQKEFIEMLRRPVCI